MKKFISILVFMVGLLACMALGNQVMASQSELVSGSHPELVSERHPELVSGSSQFASANLSASAGDVQIAFEQSNGDTVVGGSFFSENWGALVIGLLGFFDVVARLTPTAKDNSIVNLLVTVINAIIPNFKKGGGKF